MFWIGAVVLLLIVSIVATVLGVVLSKRKRAATTSSFTGHESDISPTTTPVPSNTPSRTMSPTRTPRPSLLPTVVNASRTPSTSPAPTYSFLPTAWNTTDSVPSIAPSSIISNNGTVTNTPAVTVAPITGSPATFAPDGSFIIATSAPVVPTVTLPPIAPIAPSTTGMTTTLEALIRRVTNYDVALDDPTSYQSKALRWLQNTTTGTETNTATNTFAYEDSRFVQRFALACIYYATNGVSHYYYTLSDLANQVSLTTGGATAALPWKVETQWMTNSSECTWYRITCNAQSQVEAIDLYQNRLTGSFPKEVALLSSSLKRLDLFDNFIWNSGDAGHVWLGSMTSLEYLYYGSTFFEYTPGIPSLFLSQLSNLKEYDCSYTLYSGPLVALPIPLPNLTYAVLSGNVYSSSLTSSFLSSMPSLERLYIQDASLTGTMEFMASLSLPLFELWLDWNALSGAIPSTFPSTLGSLSLSNNRLSGRIPTELGRLIKLQQLWLHNNTLTGSIPSAIVSPSSLFWLDTLFLDGNDFTGMVPSYLCTTGISSLRTDCRNPCSCCVPCPSNIFSTRTMSE